LAIAAIGLFLLSQATTVAVVFACATIYAVGKSFFWPTMLGVVSEQCPKGGALTLNATGGVGMLGVGVLGAMLMGNIQDHSMDTTLKTTAPTIHQAVMVEKTGLLGSYNAVDDAKLAAASAEDRKIVESATNEAKNVALRRITILPIGLALCYLALVLYFRRQGGYRPVDVASPTH
jgi:hypothetical protein